MNLKDIKTLIGIVEKANISSFALEEDNIKIEIKKEKETITVATGSQIMQAPAAIPVSQPQAAPAQEPSAKPAPSQAEEELLYVKSPMVGTFYTAASPDSPPYVKTGDRIEAGATVCIIEAMKLFNEIESEFTGTVEKILLKNGDPVEYGQALLAIRPE